MPRTRSLAFAELKIGLLTVVALVLAAALIILLSGAGGFSWQQYSLKTQFENAAGLGDGSPVRVNGVEVGSVTGVQFVGDKVEITFDVSEEMQPRITTGSTAAIGSVSLLGESAVDITASSAGTPIPEWGYVPAGASTGSLAEVTSEATEGIQELTGLLQDIRAGRGTVGRLFTEDALYTEMTALVGAAEDVARNVAQGRGTLGRLANDPAAAQALEASLRNVQEMTERVRKGEGALGQLMTDDTLVRNLNATTANVDAITARINSGQGTMGALINERQMYDRLNSMADRLDKVMLGLEQGQGTAGLLLRDRQMYDNLNATVLQVQELIKAITADPRRYLNVRVSLF
jgi:phospholipid/cholesterol/gamma-HCH transport system substrate-binding protein